MGAWSLDTWKTNDDGDEIELTDADLEQIATLIKDGYTSGDLSND